MESQEKLLLPEKLNETIMEIECINILPYAAEQYSPLRI